MKKIILPILTIGSYFGIWISSIWIIIECILAIFGDHYFNLWSVFADIFCIVSTIYFVNVSMAGTFDSDEDNFKNHSNK